MAETAAAWSALGALIGHPFSEPALLRRALTHRSASVDHYERLEFLGDGLLNLVVAELLFQHFPSVDEGQLSRMRSHLVRQDCLAHIGMQWGLSTLLMLGEGERRSGGAQRPSILADAVEAIIGAVYLDGGFEAARTVVTRVMQPRILQASPESLGKDAKTRLQEWLQGNKCPLPSYTVKVEGGNAQQPEFVVACEWQFGQHLQTTEGRGLSRREAEQQAAQAAIAALSIADTTHGQHKKNARPTGLSAPTRSHP